MVTLCWDPWEGTHWYAWKRAGSALGSRVDDEEPWQIVPPRDRSSSIAMWFGIDP